MSRLVDDCRTARQARAWDDYVPAAPREPRNLPTPWLRVETAGRVACSRTIEGGTQTIASVGRNPTTGLRTWELCTCWRDSRGTVCEDFDYFSPALLRAEEMLQTPGGFAR